MVEVHKPSILFLMETKIQKYQMEMIRSRLGFKNLFSVEGVGKSGVLVVLWDDETRLRIHTYIDMLMHGLTREIFHGC